MRPTTLGVLGLGAIGGSVAWEARRAGVPVLGWSPRPAERVRAVQLGALDDAPARPEEVAQHADFLVLALPPGAIVDSLGRLAGSLRPGTVVTDAARVKARIAARAAALGLSDRFAGSHPFVETGALGFDAARAGLLRGAVVYVCPTGQEDGPAREVAHFWEEVVGAQPVVLDAERHDEQVAWAVQLTQVLAVGLASTLATHLPAVATLSASTRAITRSTTSHGDVLETLLANRDAVVGALHALEQELARCRSCLATGDLATLQRCLTVAAEWRRGAER